MFPFCPCSPGENVSREKYEDNQEGFLPPWSLALDAHTIRFQEPSGGVRGELGWKAEGEWSESQNPLGS